MIPAVFVSSTVQDLHYLRDALRDAILDLAYQPVMSDHGEITYLYSGSAADACYKSVGQCQLVILIVGLRYGASGEQLSVTHKEFLSAKDANIPMIAFAEAKAVHFKELFDSDRQAPLWGTFAGMDNAKMTFRLIDEIKAAPAFNSLIPFTSAGEAKRILKLQIADFVGQRLTELIQPVRNDLQELAAEIRTLRREFNQTTNVPDNVVQESKQYLITTRFLLEDKNGLLRDFLKALGNDLEIGIEWLMEVSSLEELIAKAGGRLVIETFANYEQRMKQEQESKTWSMRGASWSHDRWMAIYEGNEVWIDPGQARMLDGQIKALRRTLAT